MPTDTDTDARRDRREAALRGFEDGEHGRPIVRAADLAEDLWPYYQDGRRAGARKAGRLPPQAEPWRAEPSGAFSSDYCRDVLAAPIGQRPRTSPPSDLPMVTLEGIGEAFGEAFYPQWIGDGYEYDDERTHAQLESAAARDFLHRYPGIILFAALAMFLPVLRHAPKALPGGNFVEVRV